MITPVIVVLNKYFDRFSQFAWHLVGNKLDIPLDGAMVPFYLAVGLRVIGRSYNMSYTYQPQVLAKLPGKIARAIVGEKHRPVFYRHIAHTGKVHCLLDHINE